MLLDVNIVSGEIVTHDADGTVLARRPAQDTELFTLQMHWNGESWDVAVVLGRCLRCRGCGLWVEVVPRGSDPDSRCPASMSWWGRSPGLVPYERIDVHGFTPEA